MAKVIFILGTSRSDGNTKKIIDQLIQNKDVPVIDLSSLNISHYDYNNNNQNDQFLDIIEQIVEFDTIVFATPVYWYSMSAQLKMFFDRMSDLITIRKPIGRKLNGKKTYLVSTGNEDKLPEGFEVPFERTSSYFNMEYCGSLYLKMPDPITKGSKVDLDISEFSAKIFD